MWDQTVRFHRKEEKLGNFILFLFKRIVAIYIFPSGSVGKRICLPMQETQEMQVRFLSWDDPLEEEMATHSSVLAWKIPWTEEHGVQSMELQRVRHD